ncbi:MAG: IS1634 family transposase [Actinomycetota bacterium]|nr:IS1634 family transposase [Actinomycetota bacterium]
MPRRAWDFGPPSVEKALGSLPVVARFARRLGIAATIDELCPVRDVAIATHGEVIEALVANRLTSPTPLLRVEDWARSWAVPEVFGIEAATLNDDRVGRALDAIAGQLNAIVGTVGARAITEFGLDVSRLHWDMTSISLHGAYAELDEGHVQPRYGRPKDRRPDLKQVQTGLAVTGDGGIPVLHRAFDGGAGEVNQVVGAMEALRSMAGERRFLLVGDSKLISYGNLHSFADAGITFVAPASKQWVDAATLASAAGHLEVVDADYVAERDAAKPVEARGRYRVGEDTTVVAPKRRADAELRLRRVFVWSSARASAAAHARTKKLDRARGDLERLTGGLGGRHYPDPDAVAARIAQIGRDRRVKTYLRTEIGTDTTGRPTLDWSWDQTALDAEATTDGWYALLTNLDPDDADATEVLRRYKGQDAVERRYGDFKGPLAVAPLFVKNNRRIAALLTVICLALLIFSLIEREVRRAIAPERTMHGLYPENRPARPTGRMIIAALASMRLIPATRAGPAVIPRPTDTQLRLLQLLDTDPTAHLHPP